MARNDTLRAGLAALFALGLTAGAAQAATLTIGSSSAAWDVADDVVQLQGEGTSRISWGQPHSSGDGRQSAYRFTGATPGTSVEDGELVTLGVFRHNNFVIEQGNNLTSAGLAFDLDLTFDLGGGLHQESLSFDWLFTHDETPNNQKPICADGNPHGIGVNRNGCADRVTFSGEDDRITTFAYAEGTVTLQVLGFVPEPDFWTVENRRNRTELAALFTFTPAPAPIPLPAAGWVLLGGLAGLAALRRRPR